MKEYKAAFTGKRDVNIYVRACNGEQAMWKAIENYHNMFGPCPEKPYMTVMMK